MSGAVARLAEDLRHVIDRLAAFYSPEETRQWLDAPHPMLDNRRAIDLIQGESAHQVLAVVDDLADVTFS